MKKLLIISGMIVFTFSMNVWFKEYDKIQFQKELNQSDYYND